MLTACARRSGTCMGVVHGRSISWALRRAPGHQPRPPPVLPLLARHDRRQQACASRPTGATWRGTRTSPRSGPWSASTCEDLRGRGAWFRLILLACPGPRSVHTFSFRPTVGRPCQGKAVRRLSPVDPLADGAMGVELFSGFGCAAPLVVATPTPAAAVLVSTGLPAATVVFIPLLDFKPRWRCSKRGDEHLAHTPLPAPPPPPPQCAHRKNTLLHHGHHRTGERTCVPRRCRQVQGLLLFSCLVAFGCTPALSAAGPASGR